MWVLYSNQLLLTNNSSQPLRNLSFLLGIQRITIPYALIKREIEAVSAMNALSMEALQNPRKGTFKI